MASITCCFGRYELQKLVVFEAIHVFCCFLGRRPILLNCTRCIAYIAVRYAPRLAGGAHQRLPEAALC